MRIKPRAFVRLSTRSAAHSVPTLRARGGWERAAQPRTKRLRPSPRDQLGGAARRRAVLHLLVGGRSDLKQPLAVGGAAYDVADVALDPLHRREAFGRMIAQRRARRGRLGAVEGVTVAGRALVHEQRRRADRAGEQPPTKQLERISIEVGGPQGGA